MYNHRWEVIQALKTEINKWTDPDLADNYPILIKTIFQQWQNPVNLRQEDMPALFYGYGSARENDRVIPATNLNGETYTLIVYATINELITESGGAYTLEKTLVERATDMHLAMEHLVRRNQTIGGQGVGPDRQHGTESLRLRRVEPERLGVSDRMYMEFHIEIDHYYPK